MQQILIGPGKYLLLMTWWIFVFFAICLYSYPVTRYLTSYIPFFVAFAVTLMFSLLLNLVYGSFTFYRTMDSWGKFATLMISYASTIIVSLIITVVLSSHGMVDYFRGDPEGSFGMLYIPSIVFYGVVGMVVMFGLKAIKGAKKRLSKATPKTDMAKNCHAS